MRTLLKRFWQYLALLAGAGLIAFEIYKPGPLTGESWFWVIVGGFIVVLAAIDIVQRWGWGGEDGPMSSSGQNQ